MTYILIESIEADGTEWGIGRNSPNPELEDYVACKTKADAVKLLEWLNRSERYTTDLLRNAEQESEKYRTALGVAEDGLRQVVAYLHDGKPYDAEEWAERYQKSAKEALA